MQAARSGSGGTSGSLCRATAGAVGYEWRRLSRQSVGLSAAVGNSKPMGHGMLSVRLPVCRAALAAVGGALYQPRNGRAEHGRWNRVSCPSPEGEPFRTTHPSRGPAPSSHPLNSQRGLARREPQWRQPLGVHLSQVELNGNPCPHQPTPTALHFHSYHNPPALGAWLLALGFQLRM